MSHQGHFGGCPVVRVIACRDWLSLDCDGHLWPSLAISEMRFWDYEKLSPYTSNTC